MYNAKIVKYRMFFTKKNKKNLMEGESQTMIINHNISAIDANRNLKNTTVSETKNMARLASGMRITRAADDASGLAVSEKMRAQIRGLNQAVRNINDGISFVQTTEGYLQGTTDSVQRIRELSVQAANGIYSEEDRLYIQVEVSQLVDEVNRIASQAQFNGMNLLSGRFDANNGGTAMVIHMGANMDQQESINIGNMSAAALQIEGVDISTAEGANQAIGTMDGALQIINKQRADLGAYQNRMEMSVRSQMNAAQNLQASESQIRDLDMAEGMVDLTRDQILNQAGVAMVAQANQKTQGVLRLLG
jgi:flagellin